MVRATRAAPIGREQVRELARQRFGDMVKAVVDLRREVMLLDAEMHADLEAQLLHEGSKQEDLWGINLYPDDPTPAWIELDSVINLRPHQGNRSRGVDDPATAQGIVRLVEELVIS